MSVKIVATTEKDMTKFAFAIQQLAQGRSNAVGTFTLTASAASTTVTAPNCGADSVVFLMPTTAHAAEEIGNGTLYTTAANGSFVVTHANNAQTDRSYGFVCLG